MKLTSILVTLSFYVVITGCASVVTGQDQQMTFNSEPEGATVTVAGRVMGKTPLTVDVQKDKNLSLTIEKEGYKTHTSQLSTSLNGWFWGNIICCGLLGSTTDSVSGAMYEYAPDQYFITLTPEKPFGIDTNSSRLIKEIIVAFGDDLRHEIIATNGQHLDELLKLIDSDSNDRDQTINALNKLAENTPSNLEFANKIIDIYITN